MKPQLFKPAMGAVGAIAQIPLLAACLNWGHLLFERPVVCGVAAVFYELFAFAVAIFVGVLKRVEEPTVVFLSTKLREACKRLWIWIYSTRFGLARRYRKRCLLRHQRFNDRGLANVNHPTIDLERVYVPLRLKLAPPVPYAGPIPIANDARTISNKSELDIWTLIVTASDGTGIAITGAPGCGKTTLLQHALVVLAHGRRPKPRTRGDIPVLIFLRECAAGIANGRTTSLSELAAGSVEGENLLGLSTNIEKWLNAGRCIVLLDGLDEIADPDNRRHVVNWIDKNILQYPTSRFVITSRPRGYEKAPLARANVWQILPFQRKHSDLFLRKWYLANEVVGSGNKMTAAVRARAEQCARNLLQRLGQTLSLQALTVNPLLLTMIAMVDSYRGALPGSRLILYQEICQVLLERWRQSRNIVEALTGHKKLVVLKPLAAYLMGRDLLTFRISDVESVVRPYLVSIGWFASRQNDRSLSNGNDPSAMLPDRNSPRSTEMFFQEIQRTSGLVVEREQLEWTFSHKCFQEYLTATLWAEKGLPVNRLPEMVDNEWWQETLRLFAPQGDASPVVEACLKNGSARALALAAECLDVATILTEHLRHTANAKLRENLESNDRVALTTAATAQRDRRLGRLRWLDDNTYADRCPVNCAEYQLYVWEMSSRGASVQPDHWHNDRFSSGLGASPVLGIRLSDAIGYASWLTETTGRFFRLPTIEEGRLLAKDTGIGLWCNTGKLGVLVDNDVEPRQLILPNNLDVDSALTFDFPFARWLSKSSDMNHALPFDISALVSMAKDRNMFGQNGEPGPQLLSESTRKHRRDSGEVATRQAIETWVKTSRWSLEAQEQEKMAISSATATLFEAKTTLQARSAARQLLASLCLVLSRVYDSTNAHAKTARVIADVLLLVLARESGAGLPVEGVLLIHDQGELV